ncbi:MAG: hypothetical protein ACI4GZ_04240 [Ruminococcus sp.]
MKRDIKLYNVIFPIWLLVLFPQFWLISVPGNLLVDFLVLLITAKALHIDQEKHPVKKALLKSWLLGFVADFAGVGILFSVYLFDLIPALSESDFYSEIQSAVAYNPFSNIWGFLWVAVSVLASAVLIYVFNRFVALRRIDIELRKKKIMALTMAIITAPYLFFLPTSLLY